MSITTLHGREQTIGAVCPTRTDRGQDGVRPVTATLGSAKCSGDRMEYPHGESNPGYQVENLAC